MLKKVLLGAFTALSLGAIVSLNIGAVEAANNIKIDEAGNVILVSDNEETDGVTALQLSLKVDSDIDVDVSFEFNSENDIKISEYRYHEETNCLNIYISDSKPLFDGEDILDIGSVSAKDIDGNSVDVEIDVVKDSLKYVYQNTLMEDEFEVQIETKPTTTTTTSTTTTTKPTTATTTSTTATTKPTTATTTSTTATTKPTTATTTSTTATTKPTTTTTTSTTKPITTTTATEANNGHIASDEEFCTWAITDYQDATGITAAKAEINENSEGMYEITLSDDSGSVLDVYVIDPDTGVGTNSANEEVNLPQTGNNAMTNVLIALGALMFMVLGVYIIKRSGIIRREENEK